MAQQYISFHNLGDIYLFKMKVMFYILWYARGGRMLPHNISEEMRFRAIEAHRDGQRALKERKATGRPPKLDCKRHGKAILKMVKHPANRVKRSSNSQISYEHLHGRVTARASVKASQQFQDLDLTRRSQAGDTEAFGELVTKYRAKIFITVWGMVGNEQDALDLAQEGFLKAWQSIHRFEGRSSFYTWLYSITVNLTIYSLRRKGRREEVELDDALPSSLPGPGVNYEHTEIREQVNAALAQLSPEHRAVIVLKELEDLQYHEIAEVLNLSMGTVMSRLFYGRKKLQCILRPIYNQTYQSRPPASVP
jgi:RNA polymerase sigma-70 factor (ECF subfamily)